MSHTQHLQASGEAPAGHGRAASSDLKQPLLEEGTPQDSVIVVNSSAERPHGGHKCTTAQTVAALLTLQLGWGLWLLPCDFARLGWVPGFAVLGGLSLATMYSGSLFTRLYAAMPNAVLFGDIGEAASGRVGRILVYVTIYSLDATRCIILHLAATQSMFHALGPLMGEHGRELPLWQCSIVVAVVVLLLGQIRYLTQLSSFFLAGTVSQLLALAIVVYDLVSHPGALPDGNASGPAPLGHMLVAPKLASGNWAPAAMAVLNMVFAFGGQFAFLELLTSMRSPARFTYAVGVCTAIMTVLYGAIGGVGYWSKGSSIHGIVIFSMSPGVPAQIAAGLIFFQAVAQYLVNLNVWTHNLLVLLSRHARATPGGGERPSWADGDHPVATGDHKSSHWLAGTAFVTAYAGVIAVVIPFFCTLVGLVTSVTYLTCAYTLPAWFALKLLGGKLRALERAWLHALIPITLALSAAGLVASLRTYLVEASGGEGM